VSKIVLGAYIGSRAGIGHGGSVIDGNVEETETSNGLVDEGFDFVFVTHIGSYKIFLSAEVTQFSG